VLEQRRVITSSLYGAASCTAYGLQRALLLIECRLNATKKSASSSKVVTRGIWSDIELLPILGLRLQAFSSVLNCSQSLDHQTGPFPARCDQGSPSAADRLTTSIGALLPIELCHPHYTLYAKRRIFAGRRRGSWTSVRPRCEQGKKVPEKTYDLHQEAQCHL